MNMKQKLFGFSNIFNILPFFQQQQQQKEVEKITEKDNILPTFSDYEIEIIQESFVFIKQNRDEIALAALER